MNVSLPEYRLTQSGFTMIELVVVTLIVSIIAVFSVSRWSATINPNALAEQLASDIRYTQSLAMTHGQRYRLNLTAPNTYSITTTGGTAVPNSVTGTNTVTLTGITFGAFGNLPNNLIAFDGQGIPYTDSGATTTLNATATIPVSTGGAVTRTIQISPTTGRVTIQ